MTHVHEDLPLFDVAALQGTLEDNMHCGAGRRAKDVGFDHEHELDNDDDQAGEALHDVDWVTCCIQTVLSCLILAAALGEARLSLCRLNVVCAGASAGAGVAAGAAPADPGAPAGAALADPDAAAGAAPSDPGAAAGVVAGAGAPGAGVAAGAATVDDVAAPVAGGGCTPTAAPVAGGGDAGVATAVGAAVCDAGAPAGAGGSDVAGASGSGVAGAGGSHAVVKLPLPRIPAYTSSCLMLRCNLSFEQHLISIPSCAAADGAYSAIYYYGDPEEEQLPSYLCTSIYMLLYVINNYIPLYFS